METIQGSIGCVSDSWNGEFVDALRKRTANFMEKEGRRPRILVTTLDHDGDDRMIKVVAAAYADLGFDVDIGPKIESPDEVARMAVENDVHIVGLAGLAAGSKTRIAQLAEALNRRGGKDILVVVQGKIYPDDDYPDKAGVVGIFGPEISILDVAHQVLRALEKKG
jgi:methylmalonyl-CoA mutase